MVMKTFLHHGNREEAEQSTQDLFLVLYKELHRYDAKHSMSTFIMLLVKDLKYKKWEKGNWQKRKGETIALGKTVFSDTRALYAHSEFEINHDLKVMIDGLDLSKLEKDILRLSVVENLKTGEIAERLGRTPDYVSNLKPRALRSLKAKHFAA